MSSIWTLRNTVIHFASRECLPEAWTIQFALPVLPYIFKLVLLYFCIWSNLIGFYCRYFNTHIGTGRTCKTLFQIFFKSIGNIDFAFQTKWPQNFSTNKCFQFELVFDQNVLLKLTCANQNGLVYFYHFTFKASNFHVNMGFKTMYPFLSLSIHLHQTGTEEFCIHLSPSYSTLTSLSFPGVSLVPSVHFCAHRATGRGR